MKTFTQLRALPRPLWFLFLAILINRMGTMAVAFLPLYLTKYKQLTPASAGTVVASFGCGALLAGSLAGWITDRLGAVSTMRWFLFSSSLVMVLFPFGQSFSSLIGLAFFLALFEEAVRPASLAAISEWAPPENRKFSYAAFRLFLNLGMSLGPAMGGFIAQLSFPAIFFVNAAATMAAGISLTLAFSNRKRPEVAASSGDAVTPKSGIFPGLSSTYRLYFFCLALIPVMIAFFQHESTLPLFVVGDLGLKEFYFGLLYTINTVIIITIELPLTRLTAHWSIRRNAVLGSLLMGAGFGILPFIPNYFGVIAGMVLLTFGEIFLFPAASAYVDEIAPPGQRGKYMGVFSTTLSVAFALGPWAGLRLYQSQGPNFVWFAVASITLISALAFSRLKPRPT